MSDEPDQSASPAGEPETSGVEEAEERMEEGLKDLEDRTEKLDEGIEEAKASWESNRRDGSVPGAQPPEEGEESGDELAGDLDDEGKSAGEAGQ